MKAFPKNTTKRDGSDQDADVASKSPTKKNPNYGDDNSNPDYSSNSYS